MNKKELSDAMSEKMDTSKKVANDAIDAFIDTITEALLNGDSVQLVGFGTFYLKDLSARNGFNPYTKEKMRIEAKKSPALRFSKSYKEKFK